MTTPIRPDISKPVTPAPRARRGAESRWPEPHPVDPWLMPVLRPTCARTARQDRGDKEPHNRDGERLRLGAPIQAS